MQLLFVVLVCVLSSRRVVDALGDGVDIELLQEIENSFEQDSLEVVCDESIVNEINSSTTFDGISWTSTLKCSFNSSSPLELSWHYKGKRLQGVILTLSDVTTNTLTIGNVSESDYGEYICLAVSCRSFSDVSIWPQWRPDLSVNVSTEKTLDVGTVVKGTCTAYPNATLNWLWDDNDFSNGSHSHIEAEYYKDLYGNSVSTVTFTINNTDNINMLRCCVHPTDVTSPICNSLTLQVPMEPDLVWYRIYSGNDSSLSLSCRFGGFPLPNLTSWSSCSSENSSGCAFLANGTKSVVDGYLETNYTTDSHHDDNYIKCTTYVPQGEVSHVFHITQTQIVPELISSNFSVNHTANGFDVTFHCQFKAQPTPLISWLKQTSDDPITDVMGALKNGKEVRPDGVRISIGHSNDGDFYLTTLTIASYSVGDYGFYTCVSYNSVGSAQSPPMFPVDNAHSKVVVVSSRSNNSFEVGDEVRVSCLIEGEALPQPSVRVSVASEFDLNYTISHGQQHLNVTFIADATNDIVIINCEAVNIFSLYYSERKEEMAILVNHESVLIDVKRCHPDDFADGSSCDLVCSVHHGPLSQPKRNFWIYFASVGNNSMYILRENTSVLDVSPRVTNYSVSLSTYFAGHYQCLITYYNPVLVPDIATHVFKMDLNEEGSQLNDQCHNSTQCLAYNAVCERGLEMDTDVCHCKYPYEFPMTLNESTSACVGAALPGQFCYNNWQCEAAQLNFNCTDFHCQCSAFLVKIDKLNGTQRCRIPVENGEPCVFDEDCQLYDPNSFCNNFTCDCVKNYIYKDFLDTCGNERVLSGGAIAGVVISTIAALILLFFFITFGRARWRSRRNRVLSSQHLALDSNDLEDEEMDFPQFNSFTHFPVIEDET